MLALQDSNWLLAPAAWHCSRSRAGDRKSWMLKGQSPTTELRAFHYHAEHKQQYFLLAIILLYSLILYCSLESQKNIRSLDFLHFYLFTCMKFNKCVSHFILHIHTIRYTSKGKEAGCCQAHQMQTAPIISNDCKLLPSHSVLNLTALETHLHSPSFYLCSNWSFGNQRLQLLETKLRSGDRYWQAKSSDSFSKGLIKFCWISTALLIKSSWSLKMNPTERLFSSYPSPLLPCHKVKLPAVSLRDTSLFHGALACILSRQSVQNKTSRLSLFQQKSVKSFSNRSANFSSPVALDRHVFVSMVL